MQKTITHINFAKGFRGGERQTLLLIEELSNLNYPQKLLVRKNSDLIFRCKDIQNLSIIEVSKPYILGFKHLKDSFILHAHETKALQFAFLSNVFLKIPYIVTRRVDNSIKKNYLNTLMYKNANVTIALSNAIKYKILDVSPKANIQVIPSAFTNTIVNNNKLFLIKDRFKNKFLIGNIGALDDKHKGQSLLIEVAKNLETSHPDIHFIFVGNGKDEILLKKLSKGLLNITFEGFVNNVNDYISSLDLFVFPSRNEGLGSILLDVMQCAVPILASDVGGIPDIIQNNVNGFLTPVNNIAELEKNILYLYNNKDLCIKVVENANTSVSNYAPRNMALSYITIYEKNHLNVAI